MTWMIYQNHVDSLSPAKQRVFMTEAEDWSGLRRLDAQKFEKESDLGTGVM